MTYFTKEKPAGAGGETLGNYPVVSSVGARGLGGRWGAADFGDGGEISVHRHQQFDIVTTSHHSCM